MNLGTNDELNHGGDFANTALQPCARITVALSQDILVSWGGVLGRVATHAQRYRFCGQMGRDAGVQPHKLQGFRIR